MRRILAAMTAYGLIFSGATLARAQEPAATTLPESEASLRLVRGVAIEVQEGRERVVVELDGIGSFRATEPGDGRARLVITGAEIDASLPPTLSGEGVVREVSIQSTGETVTLDVRMSEPARVFAVRAGRRVLWVFEPTTPADDRPRGVTVARDTAPVEAAESPDVAAFSADAGLQVGGAAGGRTGRRYTGRRIDLDFHDADIQNVLRLIAEVGNVNIVTGDDVGGSVTVRMRDVPWDLALDTILQVRGLGMVRSGNLIRVAPLSVLQRELEARIRAAEAAREVAPLETRIVPLSYNDANDVMAQVQRLLSPRGTVSVDNYTNTLIIQDLNEVLENVEQLVRVLDRQTPQVLIEARIVEASSQYAREVGIQWGGDVAQSSQLGNPTGIRFPYNWALAGGSPVGTAPTQGLNPFGGIGQAPPQNPNFLVNLPAAVGAGSGGAIGLTMGSVGGNVNLSARLSAAESTGTLRIVSSPRILTLNNAEATIAQGTLIPYSVFSALGVNTQWRAARLELKVTPRVAADGTILLAVRVTRDEPDFSRVSQRGDPTILQREAETTLIVPDGATAVIGGIYTRTTSRGRRQIPFFGSIPVLGALFRTRTFRDERSELLIFITPRIVNRASALISD